jgi:hypothetical protein
MYLYIAIAVGGALLSTVALLSFFPSLINTNTMDYALDVDAFVDNDGTMFIYELLSVI